MLFRKHHVGTENLSKVDEDDLEVSKANHFRDADGQIAASYKFLPFKSGGGNSTDIFLAGHSVDREYASSKREGRKRETRGVGVGPRFISSSKLAGWVDKVLGNQRGNDTPLRIWLYNCKSAGKDLADNGELFARSFAKKLMERGWKSTQVIGFEKEVEVRDMLVAQSLAENTPLDQRPKFPKELYMVGPRIWTINDQGEIVKSSGAYKDGTDSENGGLAGMVDFGFSDTSDEEDEA
ncbi:hypothetical protein [Pseudoxanthomonas sp. UTMC 1351]|uniref:hypothetical protein n=1 Tax=Pseudoxanthomonas sp. UTMC 1351 TaxID=2695853 RepID=UPI0034CEFAAE